MQSTGVTGHTSCIGCGRCSVVFPNLESDKRTDTDFRNYVYTNHQKYHSPLTELPIDMVLDFPIGDELHLIHLGISKRLLDGYRFGKLTNVDAKWSKFEISKINEYFNVLKGPIEIRSQRAIRSLDEITNWKGREYRIFTLYSSLPIYQRFLKPYLFNHYLLLFCGITIFSNSLHLKSHVNTGADCIKHYLNGFKILYGKEHVTSNFHNLSHLIDDVKRFGVLESFSAYPFESTLHRIKRLLKTGNYPQAQAAKRIMKSDKHFSSYLPLQL